jgi:hypothetical protein
MALLANHIVQCNNIGVQILQQGNYACTQVVLHQTLRLLLEGTADERNVNVSETDVSAQVDNGGAPNAAAAAAAAPRADQRALALDQRRPVFYTAESLYIDSQKATFYIYDNGILLREPGEDVPIHSSLASLYRCAILFNLALAYHSEVCQGNDTKAAASISIYHRCLAAISKAVGLHVESLTCLRFVVLNNLAHLYYEQCDTQHYGVCIRMMRIMMRKHNSMLNDNEDIESSQILWNLWLTKVCFTAHVA